MLHDPAEHEPEPRSEVGVWLFMLAVAVFAYFALPFVRETPLDIMVPFQNIGRVLFR